MIPSSTSPRARLSGRRLVVLLSTLALAFTITAGPTDAASTADPPVDPPTATCPAVYPVEELTPDQPVTGLTVSRGSTPEGFTGTYVGSITSGIAPGVDMLVFQLSGSRITDSSGEVDRGVWAGMSGSPVYASDGRLIGAVSYGLVESASSYAGVTPAGAMYDVGRHLQAAPARVAVPRQMARQLRTAASNAQVSAGFTRLPTPLYATTTLPQRTLDAITERSGHGPGTLVRAPRAGSGAATAGTGVLVPGGNLGVLISYGTLTASGLGTVTAVCDDTVIGFGHPMEFRGPTSAAISGGDAVLIEKDAFGSYKIGNVGDPLGVLTQDRLAAVWGTTAVLPTSTPVTTTVTTPSRSRHSATDVFVSDWLPDIAAVQLDDSSLVALDSMLTGGVARVASTILFARPDGRTGSFTRSDVYAQPRALFDGLGNDVWAYLWMMVDNQFEDIRIESVNVSASLSETYETYRVKSVEYRHGGQWHTVKSGSGVQLQPGEVLSLRVTVTPTWRANGAEYQYTQTVTVPKSQPVGAQGTLTVEGLDNTSNQWSGDEGGPESSGADSFDDLLAAMRNAPSNDMIQTRLAFVDASAADGEWLPTIVSSTTRTAPSIVTGSHELSIVVKAAPKPNKDKPKKDKKKKKKKDKKKKKKKGKGKKGKKGKKNKGKKGKKGKQQPGKKKAKK